MATNVGTGSTITFSSGFFGEILSIGWSGINREAVETSHMGTTGGRTFIPGDLYDPGELSVELNFEATDDVTTPITSAAETVTVTIPNSPTATTVSTWAASGFMTSFEVTDPMEDKMTASATIKFTGDITVG